MENNISDLELLRKFMCEYGASQRISENTITDFSDAEDVYQWTNEPLKEYYAKDIIGKKVLSVTSSGDHVLHAALSGAKDITAFDINRFSKYFAALKVAMIKTYTYNEFTTLFKDIDDRNMYLMGHIETSSGDMEDKLLSIYSDSNYYLSKLERIFWEEYFKLYKKQHISILKYLHKSHHTNNAYSKKEEYEKLRKNLSYCNIIYIDSNIDSLQYKTKEKFDLMYTSNIIGRIDSYDKEEFFELIKTLKKNLNEDGIIYDYNTSIGTWRRNIFGNLSSEEFDEILSKELSNFEVLEDKLSQGSIYKFKCKKMM